MAVSNEAFQVTRDRLMEAQILLTAFVDMAEKVFAPQIAQGATVDLTPDGSITLADARNFLRRGRQ